MSDLPSPSVRSAPALPWHHKPVSSSDIVVIIMGSTGSGKSNFIDKFFGTSASEKRRAGDGLHSHTSKIHHEHNDGKNPNFSSNLVVVDTPGFDDTSRTDLEILETIADWMKKTYDDKVNVAAIIYLHRIGDNRISGSLLRNLRMFKKLTGDAAAGRVLLTSTMWDIQPKHEGEWERREEELSQSETFWKPLIDLGARTARFLNSKESAERVMERAIHPDRLARLEGDLKDVEALLVQQEMSVLERALQETSAGKELYNDLQRLLVKQKQTLSKLLDEVRKSSSPAVVQVLEREVETIYKELESTYSSVATLKIPLFRRIQLGFLDLFRRN